MREARRILSLHVPMPVWDALHATVERHGDLRRFVITAIEEKLARIWPDYSSWVREVTAPPRPANAQSEGVEHHV